MTNKFTFFKWTVFLLFNFIFCVFLCFKFHLLPMSGISPLNLFLYKVCYLCMISRNLMKRKFSELNFYPFLVGTFTTISTHIIFVLMFLVPFKDKFKNYLSAVLPCSFVNYLVIGFPIFDSIWDSNENIMVPMVALVGLLHILHQKQALAIRFLCSLQEPQLQCVKTSCL